MSAMERYDVHGDFVRFSKKPATFVHIADYDALLNEHNGLRLLVERAILVLDSAGDALGKFNGYEAERCWPMAVALRAALSLRAPDNQENQT